MKRLFTIDLKDYKDNYRHFLRPSARGIIINDEGQIALVYSVRDKYFKFPGGGIHEDEDKITALVREVGEEVGLEVIPESVREYGSVLRLQNSNVMENTLLEQENYYYFCDVTGNVNAQNLDRYEAEAGFELRVVSFEEAIAVNSVFESDDLFDSVMIDRERRVLEMIYASLNPRNYLITKNLVLRPVRMGDSKRIHAYAGDKSIDMMMFLPNETMEDTEKFTKTASSEWEKEEPKDREYVVLYEGQIIGGVNLESTDEADTYEIGWIIHPAYRNKGFAYEAAKALTEYAFETLHADKIQAHCDSRNTASKNLMIKLGMELEDKSGTRFYPKTGVTSGEYLYLLGNG